MKPDDDGGSVLLSLIALFDSRLPAAVALTVIFIISAGLLSHNLTQPWIGHHDANGALYSAAGARNYVRYGFEGTGFGVVTNIDASRPENFSYYTHHPPLVPILVAISYFIFGCCSEWAARLIPIAFSLGSLSLIYVLGAELGGRRLGILAVFFFALLPINAYFGRMVGHEPVTNFFVLASVVGYLRWHQSRAPWLFVLSLGALVLGMASGWPAYYLAGVLPLHHVVVTERGRRDWKILCFPIAAIAMFATHLALTSILWGTGGIDDLWTALMLRTGISVRKFPFETRSYSDITWFMFFKLWAHRANFLFTLPVLVLAIMSLWDIFIRGQARHFPDLYLIPLLLLLGLAHIALFPHGAYYHDYWAFYCAAPVAILAAGGVLSLGGEQFNFRALGLVLFLFIVAVIPRFLKLHEIGDPRVQIEGPLFRQYVPSGTLIISNSPKWQLFYYAERDFWLLDDVREIEQVVQARPKRPIVFVLQEKGPSSDELNKTLSMKYPRTRINIPSAGSFQIFRIR